ncbi:MAG: hypothetical protein Ta2B_02680 [Termitinemataceae bacterium]|nr:MAG: hypothetical protein Ta2B_02680 [Termitinemataceae bacterium]
MISLLDNKYFSVLFLFLFSLSIFTSNVFAQENSFEAGDEVYELGASDSLGNLDNTFDAPFGDYDTDFSGTPEGSPNPQNSVIAPAAVVPPIPVAKQADSGKKARSETIIFTAAANDEDSESTTDSDENSAPLSVDGVIDDDEKDEKKDGVTPHKKSSIPDLWNGRRQQRYLEFGLLGMQAGVDNSIFSFGKILDAFNESLYFDPLNQSVPFSFNFDFFSKPFYVKILSPRTVDLEFFTSTQVRIYGDVGDGTMHALDTLEEVSSLTIHNVSEIMKKVSGLKGSVNVAASAFAEIGVSASKTILDNRLWFKVSPSVFFTAFYMPNGSIELSSYGGKGAERWMGLKGTGTIDIYSAYDLETDDYTRLFSSPGFDISIEGRYALFGFLDIGAKIENIPIFPSTTQYRSGAAINVDFKVPDPNSSEWTYEELLEYALKGVGFEIPDIGNMFHGTTKESHLVHRPTRFNLSLFYKPLNSYFFVVQPNFGISLNTAMASYHFNYGADFSLNLPAALSVNFGLGVFEEIWKTKLFFEVDFRVFEFDIGAALQGTKFFTMYELKGLALFLGFKFGY